MLRGSWHNKLLLSRTRVLIELIEHNLLNLNALLLVGVFILLRKFFMRKHFDNYWFFMVKFTLLIYYIRARKAVNNLCSSVVQVLAYMA